MADKEQSPTLVDPHDDIPEAPGWKPLAWFAGILVSLIALGELLIEFSWELLELIGEGIFLAVEGSEEFLEDAVEGWFGLDPWEAEMYTAWAMTPVKLFVAFLLLRALWRWKKRKLFPVIKRWLVRRWLILKRSWAQLWWPWKAGVMCLGVGLLFVLV